VISVHVDGATTAGVYAAQLGKQMPAVITRALNRAIQTGQTWTRKRLVADTGIQSKYIGRNLYVTRATWNTLEARLTAKHSRIPLIAYYRRGFRSGRGIGGVAYKLGTIDPLAFFAEVGKGKHRGIFRRRGRARIPIDQLLGPGIPEVIAKKLIFEALRGPVREAYEKRIDHEIERALAGQGQALAEAA
jgi:Prophage minor tail protein Z (GPZ)